jgi:hypothetical protein
MEYEIPDHLAKFVQNEIRKELQSFRSLEYPISYSIERIYKLIAHIAHNARPSQKKPPKTDIHLEL